MDDDEEDQCIRLLSFCKKHRAVSNEHTAVDESGGQKACEYSDYAPPPNPSGCARSGVLFCLILHCYLCVSFVILFSVILWMILILCFILMASFGTVFCVQLVWQNILWFLISGFHRVEPYSYFGRRGRKEPEVLTAASLKRLYVENRPYLVGGHSQHDQSSDTLSSSSAGSRHTLDLQKLRCSQLTSRSIISMVEKYNHMKETLGKRLAFGKLNILYALCEAKWKLRYMDVLYALQS